MSQRATDHPLTPPVLDGSLRDLRARPVETVKRTRSQIDVELRPVRSQRLSESVEHFDRRAAGVRFGLEHERGDGGDQHGLGHAALRLAVFRDIARYFATTCRMADVDRIFQVELLGHCRGVCCVMVHVVASAHLRGAAVTAPVMRNDAIAVGNEEQHLIVPVV